MTWEEALRIWRSTLAARSPHTVILYSQSVKLFFNWTDAQTLEALRAEHLEEWSLHLADRTNAVPKLGGRLARTTINKYLFGLKQFLFYALKHDWLSISREEIEDALRKYPAQAERPYEVLTSEEVKRIMEAAPDLRAKSILALALFAGLRNAEMCSLTAGQIRQDEAGCYVLVLGKGNKEAVVPLAPDVYALVQSYIGERPAGWPLFPFTTETLREIVKAAARQAGIGKHITPHSLRHTYAYRLAKSKVPVLAISKMLRHSSLAVTTGYLDHLTREETAQYAPSLPGPFRERQP